MLIAGEGRAETTFTVTYKPIEGCPDRGSLIHGIQRLSRIAKPVGAAEQPDIVFALEIERSGPRNSKVTGRMVITQGVKASDRSVIGVSCKEVTTALVLIAALSIDPDAASVPDPEPLPLPPSPYGPSILGSQPQLNTGPAPTIIPSWVPPEWRPAMIPPPSDLDLMPAPLPADVFGVQPVVVRPLDIGFGARFVVDVGPAPTPMFGAGAHLEIRDLTGPAWSLRAELSYTVTAEAAGDASIESTYRMLRGRFAACVPSWEPFDWLRLWPCASVGGGGHWAELVRRVDGESNESAGPWLELGLSGRVDLLPVPWLSVELQAGPALAAVRGSFVAGQEVVFEPPPVSFGLGAGVSAAF